VDIDLTDARFEDQETTIQAFALMGGIDIDAAVVDLLGRRFGDNAAWQRLRDPATGEERRALATLYDDVREGKERLSRRQTVTLALPSRLADTHLTRDELEAETRPLLERAVTVTRSVMRSTGLRDGQITGVFLVGGASRMPLVATMLHQALGRAPIIIEQPEIVVALGATTYGSGADVSTRPALSPEMALRTAAPPERNRRRWPVLAAVLLLLAAAAGLGWWQAPGDATGGFRQARASQSAVDPPVRLNDGDAPLEQVKYRVIDGNGYLEAGSADGVIRVWDPVSGERVQDFGETVDSSDGLWFHDISVSDALEQPAAVAATSDGMIRSWFLASGAPVSTFDEHDEPTVVTTYLWDDRPVAVSGDTDGKVIAWDLRAGDEVETFKGLDSEVSAVAVREYGGRPVVLAADGEQ
ncbi:MAG: Hsp70 family protein, partial [Stackebrandtia sp.]